MSMVRRTVVAESLGGGANFSVVANVATLVAGTAREGRHDDGVMKFCSHFG
jgi:hypothetical protein